MGSQENGQHEELRTIESKMKRSDTLNWKSERKWKAVFGEFFDLLL